MTEMSQRLKARSGSKGRVEGFRETLTIYFNRVLIFRVFYPRVSKMQQGLLFFCQCLSGRFKQILFSAWT